jgi:hypothetical protein
MRIAVACGLAFLFSGSALVTGALAKGDSPSAKPANGNPAELRKAGQCAGLFGVMAGQAGPPSSPQYAAVSARRTAWVDYGTLAAGGDRSKAQQAAINEAIYLNGKLREFGGDKAKFETFIAPLAKQCENAPPKSLPTAAVAATKPAVRSPSAETLRTSEAKMECAGFYKHFELSKRPIPGLAGGTSALFVEKAITERPDLTPEQIAAEVEKRRVKWDGLMQQAQDKYMAGLRQGIVGGPKSPDGMTELARKCDDAAYFYLKKK